MPARNEGTEVAGAHRGDEGRHRFCLLVFSVRCVTGVSTPCLCMCVLVGPRLGRRRAEDPKRRKRGDNSREHPTGDCRLAARWGRREVEGKSPSPVSSRESQRRDDAVLRATAAREVTPVKGYSSCICQAGRLHTRGGFSWFICSGKNEPKTTSQSTQGRIANRGFEHLMTELVGKEVFAYAVFTY